MALLSFEGVSKRHLEGRREVAVLDDVSFEVEQGEFVGIWGTMRSGKSTLLRVAAGIEPPDVGTVRFDGRDVTRMSVIERVRLLRGEIGLAQAEWRPTRNERVVDHVALPLPSGSATFDEATPIARGVLDRVRAVGCADMFMSWLSPSEQMRVAIARALVHGPRLLLVDEPALTPSPSERDELYGLLRSLASEPGLTLIIASEDVTAIRSARRVMSIGDGQLRSTERSGTVVQFPIGA
jgi:ABC-type ATPase involved in cell division